MFKRWLMIIGIALMVVLVVGHPSANAQRDDGLPNQYTFEDGTTINYPAEWSADWIEEENYIYLYLRNPDTEMYVYPYDTAWLQEKEILAGDLLAFMESTVDFLDDSTFDPSLAVPTTVGAMRGMIYSHMVEWEGSEIEHLWIVLQLSNGTIFSTDAYAFNTPMVEVRDLVLEILGSFQAGAAATYAWEGAATLDYPVAWEYTVEEDTGELQLAGDNLGVEIDLYYAGYLQDQGVTDVEGLMEVMFDPFDEDQFAYDAANLEIIQLGGRDAAVYRFQDEFEGVAFDHVMVAFISAAGEGVYTNVYPLEGSELTNEALALSVLGAFAEQEFDLSQTVTLPRFGTMTVPASWTVDSDENDVFLTGDNLYIATGALSAADLEGIGVTSEVNLLQALFGVYEPDGTFDAGAAQKQIVGDYTLYWYRYLDVNDEGEDYERVLAVYRTPSGAMVAADISADVGKYIPNYLLAWQIMTSFEE